MTRHVGGSFAPPLSDELLAAYTRQVSDLPPGAVKDAVQCLLYCCQAWWELPESTGPGTPHASGRGTVVALDEPMRSALFDAIPWDHEIEAIKGLLDSLPAESDVQRALRNMAFHLLWHVVELAQDREPITNDKL